MRVIVLRRGGKEERFPIGDEDVVIGRDPPTPPARHLLIEHSTVSRHHAMVTTEDGKTFLQDLGSKNGTVVGGRRVERTELRPGDEIRLGDVVLTFTFASEELDGLRLFIHQAMGPKQSSIDGMIGPGPSSLNIPSGDLVERDRQKLQVLLDAAEQLSRVGTLESMVARIVDLIGRLLAVDRTVLLLCDRATGALTEASAHSRVAVSGPTHSSSVARYVAERRTGVVVGSATPEGVSGATSIEQLNVCSAMAAPMLANDELIGVLYVDNLTVYDRFTEEDLLFLCGFASHAALAIENGRLYEKIEAEAALRQELLRFFPAKVAERLQASGGGRLEPTEVEITALFCDLTGFTQLGARLGPWQTMKVLEDYLAAMSEIVFQLEGTLEKFIGDALMAVWGAPYRLPDDPARAVRAATAMQRAMAGVNAKHAHLGLDLRIHIGVSTGPAVAGNIGSARYLQYAAIGEGTTMAARVCDKAGPGEILLTEATRLALARAAPTLRAPLDLELKGIDRRVRAWPVDWQSSTSSFTDPRGIG